MIRSSSHEEIRFVVNLSALPDAITCRIVTLDVYLCQHLKTI